LAEQIAGVCWVVQLEGVRQLGQLQYAKNTCIQVRRTFLPGIGQHTAQLSPSYSSNTGVKTNSQ